MVLDIQNLVKAGKLHPSTGLSWQETFNAIRLSLLHCYDNYVDGDIAEFGTNTGRTAAVIAHAMSSNEQRSRRKQELRPEMEAVLKRLHLFDSFKGMPKAEHEIDAISPHVTRGSWGEGSLNTGVGPEAILKAMSKYLSAKDIIVYDGYFAQTLESIEPTTRFAFVHVDCDLYQSTVEVLNHLFGHGMVSEGAIILFDDWNCFRARRDAGARRAWDESVTRYNIEHSDFQYYSDSGAKVIIHNYDSMPESELELA